LLRNQPRPADDFAQAAELLRAGGADPQEGRHPFRALAAQLAVHEGCELVLYFDTPHRLTPVPGLPARCRTATLLCRPDLKSTCLTSAAGEGFNISPVPPGPSGRPFPLSRAGRGEGSTGSGVVECWSSGVLGG